MSNSLELPCGFRAAGLHCGVKSAAGVLDLALFVSDQPAISAGLFTLNKVVGAPVKMSRERIGRSTSRGIVINSGNANACTGDRGLMDAGWMTDLVAGGLQCDGDDVLVSVLGAHGPAWRASQIRATRHW